MNINVIAKKILERRALLSFIIPSGQLQSELGTAGFQEALARRWIVPNHESGELSITNEFIRLNELRQLAEDLKYKVGDSVMVVEDGKVYPAVVAEIANGRYKLSFAENSKPRQVRDYADTEMEPAQQDPNAPKQPGAANPVSGRVSSPSGGTSISQPPQIGSAHP